MPISKPHSSGASQNKGSSSNLVNYLDKENQHLEKMALTSIDREKEIEIRAKQQHFFSADSDNIRGYVVTEKIDSNISKLGKEDAKFFAPTINFSKEELHHLASRASNGREINSVWQLNQNEFDTYNAYLKDFTRKAMDNYARNFGRENKGLREGSDLVYFAKIEHFRKFKGTDREVLEGKAKSGEMKEGLQSHIHILVSRKDKTQRMKLSPLSNEKSTQRTIGNNSYKVGFDRKAWIIQNEKFFDSLFNYKRKELERFEVQNTLKNGTLKEREEAHLAVSRAKTKEQSNNKSLEL